MTLLCALAYGNDPKFGLPLPVSSGFLECIKQVADETETRCTPQAGLLDGPVDPVNSTAAAHFRAREVG